MESNKNDIRVAKKLTKQTNP